MKPQKMNENINFYKTLYSKYNKLNNDPKKIIIIKEDSTTKIKSNLKSDDLKKIDLLNKDSNANLKNKFYNEIGNKRKQLNFDSIDGHLNVKSSESKNQFNQTMKENQVKKNKILSTNNIKYMSKFNDTCMNNKKKDAFEMLFQPIVNFSTKKLYNEDVVLYNIKKNKEPNLNLRNLQNANSNSKQVKFSMNLKTRNRKNDKKITSNTYNIRLNKGIDSSQENKKTNIVKNERSDLSDKSNYNSDYCKYEERDKNNNINNINNNIINKDLHINESTPFNIINNNKININENKLIDFDILYDNNNNEILFINSIGSISNNLKIVKKNKESENSNKKKTSHSFFGCIKICL